MKKKLVLLSALLILGTACTGAQESKKQTTKTQGPIVATQQKTEDQLKKELTREGLLGAVWVRDSGEYRALAYQAYNGAENYLTELVKDPANKGKKLAVVLDLDETVLDNSAFAAWQAVNGEEYSSEAWDRWVNAKKATAVPGAKGFLEKAKELGVEVFYISNRLATQTEPTAENLKSLGIPFADKEHILGKTTTSNKAPRLQSVKDKGYKVVILCGDNLDDFDSEVHHKLNTDRKAHVDALSKDYGTKFIVLPNPSYGGFDSGIVENFYGLTRAQKIEARKNVAKPWDGK